MHPPELRTGDIVVINFAGNHHHGAKCVYLREYTQEFRTLATQTYHLVLHLTDGSTYFKGRETGWYQEHLARTGHTANFCAGCDTWFEGDGRYLCDDCS